MTYGLETYDTNGNTRLSISDRLSRVLFKKFVASDETGEQLVPGFDPARGLAISIPMHGTVEGFNGYHGIGHYTSYYQSGSDYYVTWKPDSIAASSLILVIMYG